MEDLPIDQFIDFYYFGIGLLFVCIVIIKVID